MNTRVKKGIFWSVIIAAMVFAVNVLHYLLGGASALAAGGPYGHGPGDMGGRGGMGGPGRGGDFGAQHMMNGPHHGGGFPWLALIIGLAVLFFLVRWLRRKSKASSMQQFIDTSLMSSHTPVTNHHASMLDQWEKNIITKKENL